MQHGEASMEPSNDTLSPLANLPASPYRFPQGHRVWGKPETARVQVSLNPAAYQEIMSHSLSQGAEVGGILLGFVFRSQSGDAYHVSIEKVLADLTPQTEKSFQLDQSGYSGLLAERDRRFPQYSVVGWYHTRENAAALPVDSSGPSPRRSLFPQPWQVELVVDPAQNEGYFYWVNENGVPAALPGYYERVHPGFGWANWGKPAGPRAAAAAVTSGGSQAVRRNYTLPLIGAILGLVLVCSLAFIFLNWQKAVADRERAAIELQDTRYQLDQAVMRLLTLQPALFLAPAGTGQAGTLAAPAGSGTPGTGGFTQTPGGTQATVTPRPLATNTPVPGAITPGAGSATPESTATTDAGYPPPDQTTEPQPTTAYP